MIFQKPVSKRIIAVILGIFLVVALGVAVYFLQQQQDIRQRAAGEPDLVVSGFQLTDSGGNVRTTFNPGEEIYVRVRLQNAGGATATSPTGRTVTQIYSNSPNPVTPNTPSNVGVTLDNGQFSSGAEYTYGSIYGGERESLFDQNRSWTAEDTGTFTARAYINSNGNATEGDLTNNQATVQYTVTTTPQFLSGSIRATPPPGFTDYPCDNLTRNGITACVVTGPVNGEAFARFVNNTGSTQLVGAAAYQAYYDYPSVEPTCSPSECIREYDWIWTQTLYSARITNLSPGETTYIRVPVPSCNWQVDAFIGDIIPSFVPPNQFYSGQGTYIDGWLEQYNGIQECEPDIPEFPSPTPTPNPTLTPTGTLTPSPSPTLTPTLTPSPTGTLTPTPTSTITPTPTVTVCPVPEEVLNVRVECPFCDL